MKIQHITVRANVAWGEYQHVRIEVRMETDKSDSDKTKKDLRIEVADFVENVLNTLVGRLRKEAPPSNDLDSTQDPI